VSEQNVELVRGGYDHANRGDYDAWLGRWDPEVEVWDPSRPNPDHPDGIYEGHQGAAKYVADWSEVFEQTVMDPEEFIDQGEHVIVRVRSRGRGKGSGIEVENVRYHVITVREGKITRFEVHEDRDSALEAAGLSDD
jgi:ketosteroid isomerase-like protein